MGERGGVGVEAGGGNEKVEKKRFGKKKKKKKEGSVLQNMPLPLEDLEIVYSPSKGSRMKIHHVIPQISSEP